MSERRLIQGKITNTSSSESVAQSDEAQLRQALEHMGGQRLSLTSNFQGSPNRSSGSLAGPRHRYVRDGEVPVVHAALGRPATRPDASLQQDKALVESLRQELDRERAAHELAERSLHEARATLVTLQTRLAHVEMDLQAAQAAARQAIQEATEQQALAEALRAEAATAVGAAPFADDLVPVRRKPRAERVEKPEREPQPVKWWVKAEKA